MTVPEVQIKNLLDSILIIVVNDWDSHPIKSQTLLYNFFSGNAIGSYDYYIQAQELFLRGVNNPEKIETRIFFDVARASIPTIHIVLPEDAPGENGLGMDEDFEEPQYNVDEVSIPHTYTFVKFYNRRFDVRYHLVISSKNVTEVLLIYHLIKGMLIGLTDSVEIVYGFSNTKISGLDIQLSLEMLPPNVFTRGIELSASYEMAVPRIIDPTPFVNALHFTGTAIMEGATTTAAPTTTAAVTTVAPTTT